MSSLSGTWTLVYKMWGQDGDLGKGDRLTQEWGASMSKSCDNISDTHYFVH